MTSKTTYLGDSKIESVHEASGEVFSTYVPANNFSVREHFSPTDIFCNGLGRKCVCFFGSFGTGQEYRYYRRNSEL